MGDRGKLLTEGLAGPVRERADKPGHFFGKVRQCRMTVDGPGRHPLRGRVRARLYRSVPGSEIAINRQAGADLPMAIRSSFDAAVQRLEDHVRLGRPAGETAKRRPRRKA